MLPFQTVKVKVLERFLQAMVLLKGSLCFASGKQLLLDPDLRKAKLREIFPNLFGRFLERTMWGGYFLILLEALWFLLIFMVFLVVYACLGGAFRTYFWKGTDGSSWGLFRFWLLISKDDGRRYAYFV